MNQMEFNSGMPDLTGTTWWKRDGSDHFTIRDVLMTDSGIIIRADDGRQFNENVMNIYIQSDKPINIPKKAPVQKIDTSNLDEVSPVESQDDTLNKPLGSLRHNHPQANFYNDNVEMIQKPQKPVNTTNTNDLESAMVHRVLSGYFEKQEANIVDIIMTPDEGLESSIETLKNILNVPNDTIREYLKMYIQEHIKNILSKKVDEYIDAIIPKEIKEVEEEISVEQ